MSQLEDRLRDAFGAAAQTVGPDSVGGLRSRQSVTRTPRLGPLLVAAAVAVVVIGASVITPLVLARGQHAQSSSTRGAQSSPAASASPSAALLVVPNVTGTSLSRAAATLQAADLRITLAWEPSSTAPTDTVIIQDPASGAKVPVTAIVTMTISSGPGPGMTGTMAPSRLVTVSAYAVTIRIPQTWQRTRGLGSGVGYSGASGWIQLQAVPERAGLHAACASVAARNVSWYGRHPFIGYLRIDGRPSCQIPGLLVNSGTAVQLSSVLVEYRSPISGGANFLLISGDPATITGILITIRLHR